MHVLYAMFGYWGNRLGIIDVPFMDGECLLKAIHETNTQHFETHPVWRWRGYTSNCDTETYFRANREQAIFEAVILQVYVGSMVLMGVSLIAMHRATWKAMLCAAVIGWVAGESVIIIAHYQSDVTHLGGALEHHALFPHVPHDRFATFGTSVRTIIPHLASTWFAWRLLSSSKSKRWAALGVFLLVSITWICYAPMVLHERSHNGQTQLPTWIGWALDEHAHVRRHHSSDIGDCGCVLGTFGAYAWVHDQLLNAHGWMYRHGWIQRQTLREVIVSRGVDVLLFGMMFGAMDGIKRLVGHEALNVRINTNKHKIP